MRIWIQKKLRTCLLLSLVTLLPGCWGGENADENILVYRVQHVVVDPDTAGTVFVATDGGGIFKSTDGGTTWRAVNAGLIDFHVNWLEYDRIQGSRLGGASRWIYVGTENNGVYLSTDGGESWFSINDGLTSSPTINSIVVDPNTCLLAPACTDVYAGTVGGGVFISRERGFGTWTSLNTNLVSTDIRTLAMFGGPDVLIPSLLLAGTENGEMYRIRPTNQTETTWTALTKPVSTSEEDVYTIAIIFPNIFYAGVTRNGLWQSTNAGLSWSDITDLLPASASDVNVGRVIAANPADPAILYANALGVSKNIDGGTVWTVVVDDDTGDGPSSLDIIRIAVDTHVVDPNDSTKKVLYASTYSGKLFKYSDDGNGIWKWRELSLTP